MTASRGMGCASSRPSPQLKQVEGGVAAVAALPSQEVANGCKREGNGQPGAGDVQIERDGQIVAFPEAVGVSRLQG